MRGAFLRQSQRTRGSGSERVRKLRRVVEPLLLNRRHVAKARLNLIRHRDRREQVLAVGVRILGGSEHSGKVVARMTSLMLAHVVVHEIEIADERAVVE